MGMRRTSGGRASARIRPMPSRRGISKSVTTRSIFGWLASRLRASSPSPASMTRMPCARKASEIRSRTTGESSTTRMVLPNPVRGAAVSAHHRGGPAFAPGGEHQLGRLEHQRQRSVFQVHGGGHQPLALEELARRFQHHLALQVVVAAQPGRRDRRRCGRSASDRRARCVGRPARWPARPAGPPATAAG